MNQQNTTAFVEQPLALPGSANYLLNHEVVCRTSLDKPGGMAEAVEALSPYQHYCCALIRTLLFFSLATAGLWQACIM